MPKTETGLAAAIVEALEPRPPIPNPGEFPEESPLGLWVWWEPWTGHKGEPQWIPVKLSLWDNWRRVELVLRQDPARWQSYGAYLMLEVTGSRPFGSFSCQMDMDEIADIAAASLEQRQEAAARALGVGE